MTKTKVTKPTKQKKENNSRRKNKSQKNREELCRNLITKFSPGGARHQYSGKAAKSGICECGNQEIGKTIHPVSWNSGFPSIFCFSWILEVREDENSRYANSSSPRNLEFVESHWKQKIGKTMHPVSWNSRFPSIFCVSWNFESMIENSRYAKMACSGRDITSFLNQ